MPIPKSLHTVRVLTVMACALEENGFSSEGGYTNEDRVNEAARLLGYGDEADDYGLKAKAVRQLDAG